MKTAVTGEIEQFNVLLREAIQSDHKTLKVVTDYMLKPSGKQMRPLLTLLTAGLHGEINNKTYAAAMLFEMLHWSTLIHDDVVDEAYMRRGELTLGALARSKSAVLVGDYLFTRGLAVAARANNFHAIVTATHAIEEIVEGELLQAEHASKLDTTRKDYFEVIRMKTAVLMAAAAESGAASVDATKEQIADMHRLGEIIGIAFQIQDDLLDIEPKSHTGKTNYNDLRERKITLPLIYAMEQAGRREAIYNLRRAATSKNSLEWLLNFIRNNGGIEHSKKMMDELHEEAIAIVDKYPKSPITQSLTTYCNYVVGRNR